MRFISVNRRNPVETARESTRRRQFVTHFERIGDLVRVLIVNTRAQHLRRLQSNGLFVGGQYPSLIVPAHGELLVHPIIIDGPIASLAAIDNLSCPNGFAYLALRGSNIRIARLDVSRRSCSSKLTACLQPAFHYSTQHPVRIVRFDDTTIRYIVYLLQNNVFAIISNSPVRNTKVCSVLNEDKHMETYERDENYVWPLLDHYKLQVG